MSFLEYILNLDVFFGLAIDGIVILRVEGFNVIWLM